MSDKVAVDVGTPRETGGFDAASIVTIYVVLLIAIPSRLIVGPLGAAGTPANLAALGCGLWWLWEKIRRRGNPDQMAHPVRTLAGFLAAAVATSYFVAATRPISADELSTADMGILTVAAWLGILFLTHDGITDIARLFSVVRHLVAAGGALASFAIIQFMSGKAYTDLLVIPGLTSNTAIVGLAARDGFNRPSGTAIHAIELSVVITMLLPMALTLARIHDGRNALRRWFPVIAMVAVIPLAISRSAVVGAVVGLVILIPTWPPVARRLAVVGGVVAGVVTFLLVPGLIGNLSRLFLNVRNDPSAQSRTDSYALVWDYFQRFPLFGRGFSTFLPAHRILDNGYLSLLLDVGLVGLSVMVVLLVVSMLTGMRTRRLPTDPHLGELGHSLAAAVGVGAAGLAMFDGLSFPMAAGVLFLSLGLTGATWRIARSEAHVLAPDAASV